MDQLLTRYMRNQNGVICFYDPTLLAAGLGFAECAQDGTDIVPVTEGATADLMVGLLGEEIPPDEEIPPGGSDASNGE